MWVSVDTFEDDIDWFSRHGELVDMPTILDMEYNNDVPLFTITFDDGWKDNFINAYPTMKELDISGVIFLPTDFINSKKHFWQERMTQLLILLYRYCQKDNGLKKMALDRIKDPKFSEVILCGKKRLKSKVSAFTLSTPFWPSSAILTTKPASVIISMATCWLISLSSTRRIFAPQISLIIWAS